MKAKVFSQGFLFASINRSLEGSFTTGSFRQQCFGELVHPSSATEVTQQFTTLSALMYKSAEHQPQISGIVSLAKSQTNS